jgi:hypothetical protein
MKDELKSKGLSFIAHHSRACVVIHVYLRSFAVNFTPLSRRSLFPFTQNSISGNYLPAALPA